MSLRRGARRAELNAEINVVSLIDVMMLLLVIFMLTAPMMQGGVEIQLPTGDAKPLEAKSGLVLTISRTKVFIDDEGYTDNQFRSVFRSFASKAKDGVYLRPDANVTMQRYMDIMSILSAAGVTNFSLVAQPRDDASR